ncbi:MAG TPA: hypothetical protein VFU15_04045 [Bacteroidia bacterium]|nr:hypothetical protein [Bacteroidia bacterium]
MKKAILLLLVFPALYAHAQSDVNQVCYHDTTLVDMIPGKKDTTYAVKPQFRKGDWNIYYDFQFTKMKAECHYDKDGAKTGTWKSWFRDGEASEIWNYSGVLNANLPTGKSWYEKPYTLRSERIERNDSVIETDYFPDGKKQAVKCWTKDGMIVRDAQWCENGQLIVDFNPSSPTPLPVKKYYCNGKVKAEYSWFIFGYSGPYTEYDENGKVSVKGQFQDVPPGQKIFMPRKTGEWTYYDANGNVTKTENWSNGKLQK